MKVFYRITNRHSLHEEKRPKYAYDKRSLVEYCLKSFIEAFKGTDIEIVFLVDRAKWYFDTPFKSEHVYITLNSQANSYLYQLQLAKKEKGLVFFQEDDYYYLPNTGQKIIDGINELGFVNPYDHREFYTSELHPKEREIRLVGEQHWQHIRFNTMTWGTHSDNIRTYWKELTKHGFWDQLTWDQLSTKGVKLWSPIPGLATHMHKDFLSPGIYVD